MFTEDKNHPFITGVFFTGGSEKGFRGSRVRDEGNLGTEKDYAGVVETKVRVGMSITTIHNPSFVSLAVIPRSSRQVVSPTPGLRVPSGYLSDKTERGTVTVH